MSRVDPGMRIGPLFVRLHRTVRVAEGRQPANLPPSLGHFPIYRVGEYKDRCPSTWEEGGVFFPIHDTEAMWMSFHPGGEPVAILVGAGGINAVTGEMLSTKLSAGGYLVAPPQPWLDGWKSPNGTVYQFVSSEFKGGEGITVGEQILGAESKTGGIGLAVFQAKDPASLKPKHRPDEYWGGDPYGPTSTKSYYGTMAMAADVAEPTSGHLQKTVKVGPELRSAGTFTKEMGLGKGGEIVQKIYPDPHGIEVWKEEPIATLAIYMVGAEQFTEITGLPMPKPVSQEQYSGPWFGLGDQELQDVPGSQTFVGLKSVFVGDTSNVSEKAKVGD